MKRMSRAFRLNKRLAEHIWGRLSPPLLASLQSLTSTYGLSVGRGDIICLDGAWYVTHAGLLRLSSQRGCSGIDAELVSPFCDPSNSRWTFKATVFRAGRSEGFVDMVTPTPLTSLRGSTEPEIRVAETRAVNRALRKAYGIGICSVEEIGSRAEPQEAPQLPSQPTNGNGRTVRDRLCQIIRQYQLDANLVKAYGDGFVRREDSPRGNKGTGGKLCRQLGRLG